jgi:hypothetical protein
LPAFDEKAFDEMTFDEMWWSAIIGSIMYRPEEMKECSLVTVGEDNNRILVGFVGDVDGVGGSRRVDHGHVAGAAQRFLEQFKTDHANDSLS